MDDCKYDSMLMEILSEKKSIVNFLDSVFGFLARRTDFFVVMEDQQSNIGFPPGIKEKLIESTLNKYDGHRNACEKVNVQQTEQQQSSVEIANMTEKPKQKKESNVFERNEFYNGAAFENYCWSQTISEVEVHILLPNNIKTSNGLCIKTDSNTIQIMKKDNQTILWEGRLSKKCKSSDTIWSFSEGKLQINLSKSRDEWWTQLLVNEPEIDRNQIDCSRSLEDLPQDSQAVIEKIRHEQHLKTLGIPTAEEQRNIDILKAAWDMEGSPFKGQPFDPSILKTN